MFYLHIIHYVGFFGAQTLNALLALLIVKRAGKLFGAYRHVMLVFTLCSMLFSWVEIVTQPVLHQKGPMFVVFLDQTGFSEAIGHFIACLHCGTFGFLISVLAAQFFYRYCALCKPKLLEIFAGTRLFLIFVPSLIIYVGWYGVVDWGMSATAEKREYLKEDLLSIYHANSSLTPFIAPLYWNTGRGGEKLWRFKDVVSSAICVFIIMTLSSLILFFASKIYFHMKTASIHMSARTLELNRQLFIMLTVQTIIPFITMYVPVGLLIGLPLLNLSLGPYVNYPSASIAIYPLIEPLIAMYCIADFRKCLLRFFAIRYRAHKISAINGRKYQTSSNDQNSVVQ